MSLASRFLLAEITTHGEIFEDVISANKKREARLTAMLHLVRLYGPSSYEPLTGEEVKEEYSMRLGGIKFSNLSLQQLAVLKSLRDSDKTSN